MRTSAFSHDQVTKKGLKLSWKTIRKLDKVYETAVFRH